MMNGVEKVLRTLVSSGSHVADHVAWDHRFPSGCWVNWQGAPAVPAGARTTGSTAPYFVSNDAREASDEELLRHGVHTRQYLTSMRCRTEKAQRIGGLVVLHTSAGFTVNTERAARVAAAALVSGHSPCASARGV